MRTKSRRNRAHPRDCTPVSTPLSPDPGLNGFRGASPAERVGRLLRDPRPCRAGELAEPGRRCPQCGSGKLAEHALAAVPGWSRWSCVDCGQHAGMAESPPRTLEWATAVVLDFGRFHGKPIGEVAKSAEGRRWLYWMLDVVTNQSAATAIEAARIALGEPPDMGPPCPRCGSSAVREVRLTSGPHHSKVLCAGCGRCHRFLPRPRTQAT